MAGARTLDYEYHFVATTDEIPEGQGRSFDVAELRIAIFFFEGRFYAIDDVCPHMGASLSEGSLAEFVVACPLHAWRFDIRDGTWCDNRRVKIGSFPVELRGNEIYVGIPRVEARCPAAPEP